MIHLPSYFKLYESGELASRQKQALELFANCVLCPNRCQVNRATGELGTCQMGSEPVVAAWNIHPWEEPPISGNRGSGTIFFAGCTGQCLFCQNYPISQLNRGNRMPVEQLADIMVGLQKRGAHNINFVTPTHFAPHIIAALPHAIEKGFSLPLVYNTSGYETVETLQLLENIIDIYLPDSKYADNRIADDLSGFKNYVENNHAALQEIYRQVGSELILDHTGIARRGMIVRHMVLPNRLAATQEVLVWVSRNLSPQVHISLMAQYFPAYLAVGHPILGRKINLGEYEEAIEILNQLGMENGWIQEIDEDCSGDILQ